MAKSLKQRIQIAVMDAVFHRVMDALMKPAKARGGRKLYGVKELRLLRRALISQNL